MNRFARVALALGLALLVFIVVRQGAQSILALLRQAGWLLLLLVPLHAVPLFLDVMGWRTLIPARTRVGALFAIAAIREAINRLLPVLNVGGEIVGVHLLVRRGIPATTAATSVIVEMLLTIVAQMLFLTIGVGCLLEITGRLETVQTAAGGIACVLAIALLVIWAMRRGSFFGAVSGLARRLLGSQGKRLPALRELSSLDTSIRELTGANARLAKALVWQLAGLIAGAAETWLALRWLEHPVSPGGALALESSALAARSLFFMAPAGLGVQEAGLLGVGNLLGIGGDAAIALSLAKRMREILFGLPALAAWQWMMGATATQQSAGSGIRSCGG